MSHSILITCGLRNKGAFTQCTSRRFGVFRLSSQSKSRHILSKLQAYFLHSMGGDSRLYHSCARQLQESLLFRRLSIIFPSQHLFHICNWNCLWLCNYFLALVHQLDALLSTVVSPSLRVPFIFPFSQFLHQRVQVRESLESLARRTLESRL